MQSITDHLEQEKTSSNEMPIAEVNISKVKQGLIPSQYKGQFKAKTHQAKSVTAKKISENSHLPTDKINVMIALFNQGNLDECELIALEITEHFPKNGLGWKVLGAIYQQKNLNFQASEALNKAVALMPADAEAHYNLANLLFDQQNFDLAIQHYQKAIKLAPDFTKAHYNLAGVFKAQGRLALAETSYRKALVLDPTNSETSLKLAALLSTLENYAETVNLLKQAIILEPHNAAIYFSLGIGLQKLMRKEEAVEAYKKAVELDPLHLEAYHQYAMLLKELGCIEAAEQAYKSAIAIDGHSSTMFNNLGVLYKDTNRLSDAEYCFKKALVLDPASSLAYSNYGLLLLDLGKLKEAEGFCLKALEIMPDNFSAHNNLGLVLINLKRYEEAVTHFEEVIRINPDHFTAMSNLSLPLKRLGRLSDAEKHLKKALAINPDFFDAHLNLGSIYQGMGNITQAVDCTLDAIRVRPENTTAYSNVLFDMCYSAEYSQAYVMQRVKEYGSLLTRLATFKYDAWNVEPNVSRLRIGFVSGDFIEHPVTYFFRNVIKHIDTDKIELIAYTADAREDDATQNLKSYFSQWKSLVGLADADAAKMIHDDGVHLLIDLSGHTSGNRLPMFAFKPAPVQATWLGYWATTGVEQMDYVLADAVSLPPAIQNQFTENVKYIPDTRFCFSPPNLDIQVSALPALSNQFITIGCFQNYAKISDEVLSLWADVIRAIPNSKLRWQGAALNDTQISKQLLNRFKAFGIEADRIILLGSVSRQDYFKAHHEIDFILDSFPFSGCTTTCEALWMGVPTLTMAGNTMVARQTASFMSAVGMPDWLANSQTEFINQAVSFANNLPALAALRLNLREQLLASPVCNGALFAKNLEKACWEMWAENHSALVNTNTVKTAVVINQHVPNLEKDSALTHSIDTLMQLATEYHNAEKYVEAEALYQQILDIEPFHAEANHHLGVLEAHLKSPETALLRFEIAVNTSPEVEQFWLSYIDALMMAGKLELAAVAIEKGQTHGLTLETANMLAAELVPLFEQQINKPIFDIKQRVNKEAKNTVEQSENTTVIKFLIVAPYYSDKSAGICVLHELCDSLNKLGHQAAMVLMGSGKYTYSNDASFYGPNLQWYELEGENEYHQFIRDGIVVYPEIVTGNPLGGAHVVRYVLNSEGYVAKNKMEVSENDFILSYTSVYHKNPHAILTKLPFNPLFNADNTLSAFDRTLDVTYFGKGITYNDCFVMPNSLEITRQWPKTKAELAIVLRNTRYFYTWDYRTATISDAIFCGAIPVFLSPAPFDSFESLHDGELAKQLKTTAKISGGDVQVCVPADITSTLMQYKQSYLETVYSYDRDLALVIDQMLEHFKLHQTVPVSKSAVIQ